MTMQGHDLVKRAGGNDVADWGEKQTAGAYAPGTKFMINGVAFDPATADATIAGEKPKAKRAPLRRK